MPSNFCITIFPVIKCKIQLLQGNHFLEFFVFYLNRSNSTNNITFKGIQLAQWTRTGLAGWPAGQDNDNQDAYSAMEAKN